jgi:hypothetical protein
MRARGFPPSMVCLGEERLGKIIKTRAPKILTTRSPRQWRSKHRVAARGATGRAYWGTLQSYQGFVQ